MPHSYRAICIALGFTFLLCQQPAWSQVAREGKTTYSNFDIRDPDLAGNAKSSFRGRTKGVASQSAITNTVSAMNAAKAALAARVPTLQLEMNQWGTAPETIGTSTAKQFLTPESSRMIADTARDFLTGQAPLFGLTQKQASALVLFANYYNPAGNMGWAEYRQEANGIPIFQGEIRFGFTTKGALARLTGNLAPGLDYSNLPTKAAISPADAAAHAAATIGVSLNSSQIGAAQRGKERE